MIFGAEIEHAGFAGSSADLVHGGDGDELAAAFAVLDDAADAEGMVQDLHGVADLESASSLIVIDDDVVRMLERASGDEDEGTKGVVAGVVDAVDVFEGLAGGELNVDGGGDFDMRKAAKDVGYLNGGGGAGHADEIAGGAGMHDHVHADAALAGALAVEHAQHDGGDGEDHDDFHGDGEGADERAQRAMDEITDNQFVHTLPVYGRRAPLLRYS